MKDQIIKINIVLLLLLSVSFSFAQDSERYSIRILEECNNELANFGTTFFGDNQIIYASPRKGTQIVKNIWNPNNQPFLELFIADIDEDGEIVNSVKLNSEINSKYHESNVAFNSIESVVYFTRDKYFSDKLSKDDHGTTHIAMYKADVISGNFWTNVVEMPFNNKDYCVGHPTLSADDKTLYFSSEIEGNHNIYSVSINDDGTYGMPVKLSDRINTSSSERFPFMGENNTLYFSSDKPGGHGKLDIYSIKLDGRSEAVNLGSSINSYQDDFSFTKRKGANYGYFSSNRDSKFGDDDIYYFKELKDEPCTQFAEGYVVNKENGKKIPNALVVLYDADGDEVDSQTVGRDAKFGFEVDCSSKYKVVGTKKLYTEDSKEFVSNAKLELGLNLDLQMKKGVAVPQPVVVTTVVQQNIPQPVTIVSEYIDCQQELDNVNNIYFDLDKSKITYTAGIELDKVIAVMRRCPNINIIASSHTDCRASDAYNDSLSQRRAQATVDYISNQGNISLQRLRAIGYGERRLTNRCADNVRCSEREHQRNRRTQFEISNY